MGGEDRSTVTSPPDMSPTSLPDSPLSAVLQSRQPEKQEVGRLPFDPTGMFRSSVHALRLTVGARRRVDRACGATP